MVDKAEDGSWGKIAVWNSPVLTTLDMKVNRTWAFAGNILMYQFKVRNMSPIAQDFSVSLPIPDNTTFLRREGNDYDLTKNVVTWKGTVQSSEVKVGHVWVYVNPDTKPGTVIEATATLTDDALGDSATVTTKVKQAPPRNGHRTDVERADELVVRGN